MIQRRPDSDLLHPVFVERTSTRSFTDQPVTGEELGTVFEARTRDFDVGLATMALITQAGLLGLSAHLLGGIDLDAAHELTGTDPDATNILCGFVLGHKGDGSELAPQLREREAPSDRKPAADFAMGVRAARVLASGLA